MTGHQVRAVEADGSGVLDDLGHTALDVIAVPGQIGVLVRGDGAAGFHPGLEVLALGEVLDDGLNFGAVLGGGPDVAGHEDGLAVGGIEAWEVEEAVVFTGLGAFGEEAGDEVALLVHPALGALGVEHGQRGVAEVGLDDAGAAAVDVLVLPDVRHDLGGLLDFGRGEGQGAGDPLVVVLQRGGAQHDLFHPVGGRPTGGRARLDAHAPRRAAVGDHLVHQGLHFFPGLGDGIAGFIPGLLGIPDQRLAVDAFPDTGHDLVAALIGHHGHVQPRLVVVGLQRVHVQELADVDDLVLAHEGGQQAGLREVDDVGGVARVHRGLDRGLEFLGALILHIDAGLLFKGLHRRVKLLRVGVHKRTSRRDFRPLELTRQRALEGAASSSGLRGLRRLRRLGGLRGLGGLRRCRSRGGGAGRRARRHDERQHQHQRQGEPQLTLLRRHAFSS